MDRINVGMIGAGVFANLVHYPSLCEFRDVNIAAICDINEERLNKTADKYGVQERYKDYKVMLEKVKLDAVHVIMPPVPLPWWSSKESLVSIVVYCLRKKKHVFIEKPPGASLEEAKVLAKEAEINKCKTMVGFNRRFIPVVRKAREIIEERGPPTQFMVEFHKNMIGKPLDWGKVNYLISDVIHAVDLLRWLGGEVKKVHSIVSKNYSEHPNSYNALIEFRNGSIGLLNSTFTGGGRLHRLEIHGKGISAIVDMPLETEKQEAVVVKDDIDKEIIRNVSLTGSKEFHKCYGYYQEERHFIDCIKEDKQPETSFQDALKSMELATKILENYY